VLPRNPDFITAKRFATFKLFYTEDTPDDYEPPCFVPGDFEKDRFVFKTHSHVEQPHVHSIGVVKSGFHMFVRLCISNSLRTLH
jgi:meiosis-specific protein HOP1